MSLLKITNVLILLGSSDFGTNFALIYMSYLQEGFNRQKSVGDTVSGLNK